MLASLGRASLIVGAGVHASLDDFLDRQRSGLASTFLTRLRVGPQLVDARACRSCTPAGVRVWHLLARAARRAARRGRRHRRHARGPGVVRRPAARPCPTCSQTSKDCSRDLVPLPRRLPRRRAARARRRRRARRRPAVRGRPRRRRRHRRRPSEPQRRARPSSSTPAVARPRLPGRVRRRTSAPAPSASRSDRPAVAIIVLPGADEKVVVGLAERSCRTPAAP